MATVTAISAGYIDRLVQLDPLLGTDLGDVASSSRLPDFSPAGVAAREDLVAATLKALDHAEVIDDAERRAHRVISEALASRRDWSLLGEDYRELRNWWTPLDRIRGGFDLMPSTDPRDWPAVVERMLAVPDSVAGIEATLRAGAARNLLAARRQALVVAEQAATWGGVDGAGYFTRLLERAPLLPAALRDHAASAAGQAEEAMRRHAIFLTDEYAPRAPDVDAVGRERYAVAARGDTGLDLDLEATYAWGWEELRRLRAEIDNTAALIVSGGGFAAARSVLNSDPARAIHGVDAFRAWLQDLTDRSIAELDDRHFDIPRQGRRVECMIAPPGSAAAMYYTSPSEDWSRPGRTWYPVGDLTVFPIWGEVTTAYHEGVPGHHLQQVQAMAATPPLNRFQRAWFHSGHGEGWALYAERLMDELGYHEQPDTRLGMLSESAFRAARVVVDIGLHLQLAIPKDEPMHGGRRWDFPLACTFIAEQVTRDAGFVISEVHRYLGMPGQAISYKVGEREWLDIREHARARQGPAFDLKRFHTHALALGPMGLGQLRAELTQSDW